MPCCGDREKGTVSLEEKWDYVNIGDFKSESCFTPFSYIWLWIFLVVSFAVYGVDTFTAVNLLAFSRWSGQIEPAIPFKISRWIFAVCIIISFALLVYRWLRAFRAIRSGSIAQSYLDSLAVRIQSTRMGSKGRGWRRFLVFAELTKSKKGAEYVALFAYFSFESWMNTVFADGPRQVVNAITLYSVMQMDLLPGGENAGDDGSSGISQFFNNVKIMAEDNDRQALVLFGMLFTLVIWVLSVLKLALAVILYLIFLFHHIPAEDGTLKAYCRRKINKRLMHIVKRKVDKALHKGFVLQDRQRVPTQPNLGSDTKPTLPAFGDEADKIPSVATISRTTTQTTLPPYTSRPGTAAPDQNPTLPNIGWSAEKPSLTRTTTQSSAYSDSASLTGNAAVMGYSPLDRGSSPAPPVPPLPSNITPVPAAATRSNTPMSRPGTTQPRFTPGPPSSVNGSARGTPAPGYRTQDQGYNPYETYPPQDSRTGTPFRTYTPANDPYARPMTPSAAMSSANVPPARSFTPASHGATPHPPAIYTQPTYGERSFTPASRSAATPRPPPNVISDGYDGYNARSFTPAARSATTPRPPPNVISDGYTERSFTPASRSAATPRPPPNVISDGYSSYNERSFTPAARSATTPRPLPSVISEGTERSYTPFNPSGTPAPQSQTEPHPSGYAAFNPSANDHEMDNHAHESNIISDGYTERSFTPASRSAATPRPLPNVNTDEHTERSYTPFNPSGTPAPQPQTEPQQSGYAAFSPSANDHDMDSHDGDPNVFSDGHAERSYTPFNPSEISTPQPEPQQTRYAAFSPSANDHGMDSHDEEPNMISDGHAERSYTPFSPSGTPAPQSQQTGYAAFSPSANDHEVDNHAQEPNVISDSHAERSYTPFSPSGTPKPKPQQTGYAAFNPSANNHEMDNHAQEPSSPVYRSYTPSNTAQSEHSDPAPDQTYSPQPYSQSYGRNNYF